MKAWWTFFFLADPNVRYVVVGTMLLTSSAAIVGSFALLKKKALVGDAIAHAVLPGICLAFMVTGTKHPVYLTFGAFITGWLSLILIDFLTSHSKIKEDIAIALVLSVTFGVGTLLLSIIQNSGNAAQVGLNNYLFGKAAAMLGQDMLALSWLSLLIISIFVIGFKEFKLVAFDKAFAQAIGLPVKGIEFLFTSLTVLAVIVGIRAVGIVLMAAMLITPAAAARFWTDRLIKMIVLSALLGMLSGLIGSFISYTAPGMPTGPWIVLSISFIAYISFLFAPHKGFIAKKLQQVKHHKKTLKENILKLFYELGKAEGDFFKNRSIKELLAPRSMSAKQLERGLKDLTTQSLLQQKGEKWCLTGAGKNQGEQVSERHLLWEFYLTHYLKIKPDHVHEDAESIEHILTPDLVEALKKLLKKSARVTSEKSN
jgi:manganese/zinc/iron transport system permease protein